LSDLFFDFLDLAEKVKPKVIVAENVKGMIQGNAKHYVRMIAERFEEIGYNLQIFLLNASTMGVPQKRERLFFIAGRKDLDFPKIKMEFEESPILFGEFDDGEIPCFKKVCPSRENHRPQCKPGYKLSTVHPK
jgi:DNA (cytosine-5)-methyltransferase 1